MINHDTQSVKLHPDIMLSAKYFEVYFLHLVLKRGGRRRVSVMGAGGGEHLPLLNPLCPP